MSSDGALGHVVEPQKEIPIAYDVDVAVVGAGISGLFAAIAAGRLGAKTLLIDRFGAVGGNIGPGMIIGGSAFDAADATLPNGVAGIHEEMLARMEPLRHGSSHFYPDESNIISYLGVKMAEQAGVELLLSVTAADPIIEGNKVTGIFVEGKSGRVAVKAKVVVDASGEGDIASRAGVPMVTDLAPDPDWPMIGSKFLRPEFVPWNDTGIYYVIANVDVERYKALLASDVTLSEEEGAWVKEAKKVSEHGAPIGNPLVPFFKEGWDSGEYLFHKAVEPLVYLEIGRFPMTMHVDVGNPMHADDDGLVGNRISMGGAIRRDDMKQISRLESAIRVFAFETARFFHDRIPGFEESYLLFMSPYFSARGGPYIDGEYTLTPYDLRHGVKFDDVMFQNIYASRVVDGKRTGFDTPYRTMLPKEIDGLLATGRVAAYVRRGHDPGTFRARNAVMLHGEAAGTAAALAAKDGVAPRDLDVKKLQRQLIKQGLPLGDKERLAELELQ